MNKLNAAERLQKVIDKLFTTPDQFAKNISVARAHVVYDVLNDRNEISWILANRIIETYPNIRIGWLLTGIGDMLKCKDKPLKYREVKMVKGGSIKSTCKICKEKDLIIDEYKKIISHQRQLLESLTYLRNTEK